MKLALILLLIVGCAKSVYYVRQYGLNEILLRNVENIVRIDTIGTLKKVTFKGKPKKGPP